MTRTMANAKGGGGLDRLNEDLQDVTRIMTKNMEDLLWRGDSLDRAAVANVLVPSQAMMLICPSLLHTGMSTMSTSLRDESLKYRKAARNINLHALYRKWAPVGVLGLMFLILLWWKFW